MRAVTAGLLVAAASTSALDLDITDASSVNGVSKSLAQQIMGVYNNQSTLIPGLFPDPWYWWMDGLAWDSVILYWAATGDTAYNSAAQDALMWQSGPDANYMPTNQTRTEGNDDQAIWALAAMTAAERGFPHPTTNSVYGSNVTYLQLAQNVFDAQAARWDEETCRGGLRWQIYTFNAGYNYKNSFSNGAFYQLAARLALATGNQSYVDWADKAWQWSMGAGLITQGDNGTFAVYDGTSTTQNCSRINRIQWTATAGLFLEGAAYLYNVTASNETEAAIVGILAQVQTVFTNGSGILVESACASAGTCTEEIQLYRGMLARALAAAKSLYPASANTITPILQQTAVGAAGQCTNGADGPVCGSEWGSSSAYTGKFDLSVEVSTLNVVLANLEVGETAVANGTASGTGSPNATTSGNASTPAPTNGASGLAGSIVFVATMAFVALFWI